MSGPPDLQELVAGLAQLYPQAAPLTDPLALIVWENVGYLVDDARRAELFEAFSARIGLDPLAMAEAPEGDLLELARGGGMRPEARAGRLRGIGELALRHAGGDLMARLKASTPPQRRKLLRLFPGIGDPGADKILLFSGLEVRPALESNGLRTLVRLGLAAPDADYARCYKAAVRVLAEQGRMERGWLVSAFQLLRAHGQAVCRRKPLCFACPLDPECLHQPAPGA